MSKKISSKSFLLLAHYATFAYQDLLFNYLTDNKAKRVTKINFPLPELPTLQSIEITETKHGEKTTFKKIFSLYKPPLIAYFIQSLQLLYIVLVSKKDYDVVIAEDSLLALLSILLKKMGKCKKIIFYSHGIDKSRFSIRILNHFYQKLDKYAAQGSDFNWFLNKNMIDLRQKQHIPKERLYWMPASVPIKTVKRKSNVFNHHVVFLGVTNKKNGAHIFIDIVKKIKKDIPTVRLDIIGTGDMDEVLHKKVRKEKLQKWIKFLGLLEFKDFCSILTDYSVGIAPYEDRFDTLTASSDSMKMRVYLAAGVPVVITKGFIFSEEISNNNLGLAVPFNSNKFADAIIELLKKKKLNREIRQRALAYSRATDIYTIYDRTFGKIL